MSLDGILVYRTGIEHKRDALSRMKQHDRGTDATVVSKQLNCREVVGIIGEVEENFI